MKMNSVFIVITIILPAVLSQQCGPSNPCPNSMCCSQYGWCGCDAAYCGSSCQNHCNWCQTGGDGNEGIGVNYGRVGNNLPQPSQVVKLIKSLNGVKRVKIFDTDQTVLRAFSKSGIKLTVAVTNQEYPTLARSQSAANAWVKKNISPVYPSTDIEIIAVGNEVLSNPDLPRNDLVPAMRNLNNALNSLGYRIKVSTPLATDILAKSYPPSAGEFRNDGGVISSLLDFLRSTNSVFMVNVYTFFSWQGNPKDISLDYALFRGNAVVVRDGDKGYTNLFDAMVDAIYSAMEKAGHPKLQLVIGESGWPSAGAKGATVENARTYNAKLVDRMKRNVGTPKRPGFLVTFIFALFNENKKNDPELERHFGILYPDGSPVYPLLGENTNSSILHSTM